MPPTRRTFLHQATAFSALAASTKLSAQHSMANMAPSAPATAQRTRVPMLHSLELASFVDALPIPQRIVAPRHGALRITMREIYAKLHRDVPPTRLWSYADTPIPPVIEAQSHQPLRIEWINQLPQHHFLPIDYSLHGCGHDLPEVRACVHLHGGKTPSASDGYPEDWFTPGQSRICTYPLQQPAATLWYHDHAMGLNRLNMYAGLSGMLLIRDPHEQSLGLPSGKYEIPLTLFDRDFTQDGQLFYPDSGIPGKPWVPEFTADAILVNGKIRPYLEVEPTLYRFRVLNAANSRFFALSVVLPPIDQTPTARNTPPHHTFHQIGTDQGFLAAPAPLKNLVLAPGERADLLIDFSSLAGKTVALRTGAQDVLQFRIASAPAHPSKPLPTVLQTVPPPDPTHATVTRTITLNEYKNGVGNSMVMLLNRKHWHEPITETPKLGTTEIWEFVNLTEDTHPMHLHLVRFRLLDRRTFEPFDYLMHKKLTFVAPATGPEPQEAGWKDVVQCPAGQITRILVTFDGYAGKYLYHCHILEHEANDMMRPFEVLA